MPQILLKSFQIIKAEYIFLFKEFITSNNYLFINKIKKFCKKTEIRNYIQFLIDQIINDIQRLFTQNIMSSISMMEKLNNFIENDFKIVNWQNR